MTELRQILRLVPKGTNPAPDVLDLDGMPSTSGRIRYSADILNAHARDGLDSRSAQDFLRTHRQLDDLAKEQRRRADIIQASELEQRIAQATGQQVVEREVTNRTPLAATRLTRQFARNTVAVAVPIAGKLIVDGLYLAGHLSWLTAKSAKRHPRVVAAITGLAGLSMLVSDTAHIPAEQGWLPGIGISQTVDEALPPLPVPYSADQMRQALHGINQYNFAPGQKDKTDALKATRAEIAILQKSISAHPASQLSQKLADLKASEQQQLSGIKPNTKLDVMIGAKWAILNMPRATFNRGLKGIGLSELYGFFIGKSRIESALTNDAEFAGASVNHARGVVQLETQPFLALLSRHYETIGKHWPKSDRAGFESLRQDLLEVGGSKATIAQLNAADSGLQTRFRDVLIDKTPVTMPDGSITSRGVYLSFVIAQYYIDEAPKPPADLAKKYGANVFRYLVWQMGGSRYEALLKDYEALKHYDDKAVVAASQLAEGARERVQEVDARMAASINQQKTNQAQWQALQPKRVKHGRTVRTIPQTSAQKRQQAILVAQQKQLKARAAQEAKRRAKLFAEQARLDARVKKLRAPLDHYHKHLFYWDENTKKWKGQAANNPMWWRGKIGGDLRMPDEVFAFVRDKLEMGKLSRDAETVAANVVEPLRDWQSKPADLFVRLPHLQQVNNTVVYVPAGQPDPVPVRVVSPARIQAQPAFRKPA